MLRSADRFTVGMAEMPRLTGKDEATYEAPVDELGALAGGASSTANPALGNDRCQASPSSAMDRARVLRLVASPCEPPAARRAEALMLRDGDELTPAAVAPPLPEGQCA